MVVSEQEECNAHWKCTVQASLWVMFSNVQTGQSKSHVQAQIQCRRGLHNDMTSLVAQTVKSLASVRETQVWSLGRKDTLEKEMATHSGIHAWKSHCAGKIMPGKIPWFFKLSFLIDANICRDHIFDSLCKQIADIHWIMGKAREFQKTIYFCFIDYTKTFDCVNHNKLWTILKVMGVQDHIACLLRNLSVGQKATVRTGHGKTGSKLGKKFDKIIYCHAVYLTSMQSTSCEMLGWVNHKLESRLPGEISTTSDMQMMLL